jgi:hypothetical protein
MALSFALYAWALVAAAGVVSIVRPLKAIGIRNRWIGWLALAAGVAGAWTVLDRPALADYATARDRRLDVFMPIYQFSEVYEIPVHAPRDRIYRALLSVSADEIPFYRTLAWIRRGAARGPESVLNPPDGVPLITVATRTSFLRLAEEAGRELVIGTVVIAPPGVRLAVGSDPASFMALEQEGFAKAAVAFLITPRADGWAMLRTDTRVWATDPVSRDRFARYWRVIAPGSAITRLMWLRAIKVRAEAPDRSAAQSRPVAPPA